MALTTDGRSVRGSARAPRDKSSSLGAQITAISNNNTEPARRARLSVWSLVDRRAAGAERDLYPLQLMRRGTGSRSAADRISD